MLRAIVVALVTMLLFAGCELNKSSRPSVLIIAVEGLGFETFSCESDELLGFKAFCEEAVRFSHAFTPSTLSQPTMASLVTGLYPYQHGVRDNGSNFLSAKYSTIAEGALAKGYHTLFVSGGPPIWRKSGLAQGFEIFDDSVDLSPGVYYRPVASTFKLAMQWLDQQQDGRPFFAVTFLSDLQFPLVTTQTSDGELREQSFSGQVDEIDESLLILVRWLKENKIWNSTNIVLIGLNSLNQNDEREPQNLNLKSRATQVALFIKPARKEADNIIQWSVDRNVSLVDVAHTTRSWLALEEPQAQDQAIAPQNLNSALQRPEPNWPEERLILSESAWPAWIEGKGVRTAIRQNQFLFIHDTKPLIYNMLSDRMENLPLKTNDPLWSSLNGDVTEFLSAASIPPFEGVQDSWNEAFVTARKLWVSKEIVTASGQENGQFSKWYLRMLLAQQDWRGLKRLAQEIGDPVGAFVAARHLGEHLPMPRDPCVRLLLFEKGDKKSFQSECEDDLMLSLYSWQAARKDEDKFIAQEKFLKLYGYLNMDSDIGRLNYLNGLRWDVSLRLPERPRPIEYILTLTEYEALAFKLKNR